jgi:hypothetical protein
MPRTMPQAITLNLHACAGRRVSDGIAALLTVNSKCNSRWRRGRSCPTHLRGQGGLRSRPMRRVCSAVDGRRINSFLALAVVNDTEVTTIDGLAAAFHCGDRTWGQI